MSHICKNKIPLGCSLNRSTMRQNRSIWTQSLSSNYRCDMSLLLWIAAGRVPDVTTIGLKQLHGKPFLQCFHCLHRRDSWCNLLPIKLSSCGCKTKDAPQFKEPILTMSRACYLECYQDLSGQGGQRGSSYRWNTPLKSNWLHMVVVFTTQIEGAMAFTGSFNCI